MKPFFLGPLVLAMTMQPLALYALESPLRVIAGCHLIGSTLVRTQAGRTTMTHVSLGAHDIDPCSP